MKLVEALGIIRKDRPAELSTFRVGLVCGFSPLHLQTFLAAHWRLLSCENDIQIIPGLYGDIWGNLHKATQINADGLVIILEWGDLDGRLGLRGLGSWSPTAFPDIMKTVEARCTQLYHTLLEIKSLPIVICFPTLPFPPVSFATGWESSELELTVRMHVQNVSLAAARLLNVRVANCERLDRLSPLSHRFDPKSELAFGFPYKLPHASALAEVLAHLICQPIPKKGLITDLDDTLWKGILGEDGVESISWDLEHLSHSHALYQRFLHALSSAGVMIAVASRNDPRNVEEAFKRQDLIIPKSSIFPIEAHWDSKSESVRNILSKWNVGADSVVFVDDSAIELAEVKAAHPQIECVLFPQDDPQALDDLFQRLRDLFGKTSLSEEDAIRLDSIRLNLGHFAANGKHGRPSLDFLKQAQAQLTFHFAKEPLDRRALELVNKTNQFNLNGKRYTEVAWSQYINRPDTFLMIVEYRDKYGPLGKVAVLTGRKEQSIIIVDSWVMSCRAFGRQIEHRCLEELFSRFKVHQITFRFRPTTKNGPLRNFLHEVFGRDPESDCRLQRTEFVYSQDDPIHQVLQALNE